MKIKTSELTGAALDWAVAMAIKWIEPLFGIGAIRYIEVDRYLMMETPDPDEPEDVTKPSHFNHYEQWSPSRIWSQGGPLIEKYRIMTRPIDSESWLADLWPRSSGPHFHESQLIAACRAIVASRLGDEIEIPEELCKGQ